MKFKGQIISCVPCKGYAFIRPSWAKVTDGSRENIYCYYASDREKASRRCFITLLDKQHPENHIVQKNKRGEEIYLPAGEPQVVWFETVWQDYKNGYKLMAINLVDEKHITDEERDEAEKNANVKPDLEDACNLAYSKPIINDSVIDHLINLANKAKEVIKEKVNNILMLPAPKAKEVKENVELVTPEIIYLGTSMPIETVVENEYVETIESVDVEEDSYDEYDQYDDEYDPYDEYDEFGPSIQKMRSKKPRDAYRPKVKNHRKAKASKYNYDDLGEE